MDNLITLVSNLDEHKINELMERNNVPGVSIGVFNSRSKYYRSFGFSNGSQEVDENTVFRIASLTKPVFSFLYLSYVIEGIFNLDTPVTNYYSSDQYPTDERMNLLTSRLVLSHQTGFPNWKREDELSFIFTPGEKFSYCGEGYVLLQNMLEKHFRKPAFELLEQDVYDMLNMNLSALFGELILTENKCVPHDENGLFMENRGKLRPNIVDYVNRMPRYGNVAGTMWCSITDYTTFLHHLCFNETYKDIFELMTTEQVKVGENGISWGLGIGLDRIGDQKIMWHWGSDNGFKTFTLTFLDDNVQGITIFTNAENGKSVYKTILKEILPELPNYLIHELN